MSTKLLTVSRDAKTVKGQKQGYLTGILYLAPHTLSGRNLCPDASPGCIATCLNTAGRGVFQGVQSGRIRKSHYLRDDRQAFMVDLIKDISALVRKANREGFTPLVRLNGTSDIPWENVPATEHYSDAKVPSATWSNIMARFPSVQFYDYTKSHRRMLLSLTGTRGYAYSDAPKQWERKQWPANYHLTFSRSECNGNEALDVLRQGGNVAVVYSTVKGQALPTYVLPGVKVIDGDVSDVRHTNATNGLVSTQHSGVVIGLRAKGKARKDTSGFVVKV